MSSPEEQVALIDVIKNELCNKIAPHHCLTIAQSLKINGKISEEECNKVIQLPRTDKTKSMIEFMLKRKAPGFFLTFLTSLQEAGLSHVRDEIEGKLKPPTELQETHKHMMEIYFPKVITKLKARDVLDNFPDILDEHTKQIVCNEVEGISQNAMFLHHVLKNPNSIEVLLQALRSGQCGSFTFLVDLLEGKEKFSESDSEVNMKVLEKICTHSKRILVKLDPLHLRNHLTLEKPHWDAIKREETRRKRAIMFLNILANSETPWFKRLLLALTACKERDYSELCSKLEEESEDVGSEATHSGDVAMETDVWEVAMETDETVVRGEGNTDVNEIPFVNVADRVDPVGEENPQFEGSFLNNFDNPPNPPVAPTQQNQRADPGNNIRDNVEKLELRDYQLELAAPALAGENSMIVAPTGSGKTYVALKICAEHIKLGEDKKAIFLVPRVPLVRQQHQLFKRILGDAPDLLLQVTGETSNRVPVNIALKSCKIAFMTPQILLNMLREKLVTISEFTLLIIDECHHTVKDDPYNNIMKIYLDKRLDASSDVSLPQIVGLTASPGMGKAKKMSQAEENIKTLMANLDVTKAPTQVNLSTRNLKTFQNETRDQTISILRAPDDDFRQSISKSMDEIETLLEKEINLHQNDLGGEIKFNLHARKGSQDYEAWVITLRNRSKTLANDDLSHKLMMFAEHLLAYNTALVLNDHVRSSDAEDQLFELMEKYKSENPVVLRLRQIYETNKVEPLKQVNDLLLKLHKVLLDEFSRQNDSRCIIFVRTRSIAGGVITYMEEEQDLMKFGLNPKLLTGAGVSGDKGGMTKREQESTLGAFRQGKCKVIVATSVAEEGLDIQACNLIITYNYSTNEVGHVQRKGRGRAANSQIVTLAYDDSGHVQKERENKIRVELTEEMLGTIRGIPPKTLKDQIREIQIKAKKERDLERKIKARLKPRKKTDEVFNLQCLWCKQHATTTQHLRHINKQHRVIVDPGFVQRAVFKTEKDPQKWKKLADDHFVTGKMFCANQCCRNHLGYRMKHKHLTLSVPKVTCFLFTDQSGSRETFEKWSQVTFKVNELNEQDLAELLPLGNLDNEIEDVDYD